MIGWKWQGLTFVYIYNEFMVFFFFGCLSSLNLQIKAMQCVWYNDETIKLSTMWSDILNNYILLDNPIECNIR